MKTTCKACNVIGNGMISIYDHPNNVDAMYTAISGIEEIWENDAICIPCYDDLKIAYNFKQKCIQTNLVQKNKRKRPSIKDEIHEERKERQNPKENNQNQESDLTDQIEAIASSSTSLEKSILLDQNSIVECESIEAEEEEELFTLLNIVDNFNESQANSSEDIFVAIEHLNNKNDGETPTQSNTFSCNECGKTFNRIGNLKRHQQSVHCITAPSTKIGRNKNRRGPSPKLVENDIFAKLKETQCEYCFSDFGSEKERHEHETEHKSQDKPYICFYENCKSQFKERFNFRQHLETHSKVKKYQCRYCDQRFHQQGNAKCHERYHTGEKPFVCHHCGKSFAENGNLKSHIRLHTGERPYACPECPKRFTTHYSHKIHIRSHTKEKPYLCSDCGKRFSSSGKLLVHKRIHSGDRPYKCDTCSACFVDSSNLKRHSKIHV